MMLSSFCPSQGPLSDCSALCHFAHSPSHGRLQQGRGALRWLHDLGRVQLCHQGWPNKRVTLISTHTRSLYSTTHCSSKQLHQKRKKSLQVVKSYCSTADLCFRFRSPTTTRLHQVSSPTSPQTLLASRPAFPALSLPAASTWRPTRTVWLLCRRLHLHRTAIPQPCNKRNSNVIVATLTFQTSCDYGCIVVPNLQLFS